MGNQGASLSADSLVTTSDRRKQRADADATPPTFAYISFLDAMIAGGSCFAALAILLPPNAAMLMAGLFACVVPLVTAIAVLGYTNTRVPYVLVGAATCIMIGGAYLLSVVEFDGQPHLHIEVVAVLFAIAIAPQYVALWSSAKRSNRTDNKPDMPCNGIGFVSVAVLLVVASIACVGFWLPEFAIDERVLTGIYAAAMVPPVAANWLQARREQRLPVKRGDKQPDHISGLGASTLILFVIVVVTLGLWATATGVQAQISVYAGLIVLVGLLAAFGVVAFGLPSSTRLNRLHEFSKTLAMPIGWVFSMLDSLLVFAVANALGANERDPVHRFALLLGTILPSAALGWWLPAPYGLVPLMLALLGSIAIARRWAWVEEDRENAMLARRFDGDHIRVGFTQDLKDEALVGFAILFVVVPIGLRQLHLTIPGGAFTINPVTDVDSLFAWLSFFGTEMAKAVPFVDWTEIYRVKGDSTIKLHEATIGAGQHVVFGMRILVDLVLLAAFLQAIAITQRTRKLKQMFYDEESLDRLDPFIEPHEFRKLVRRGPNGLEIIEPDFKAFPVYDPDRLEELKQRGEQDELGFVAARLLDRDEEGGPEEQLARMARHGNPNLEKCLGLLSEIAELPGNEVKIGPLKAAHYQLNRYASLMTVRKAIAEQIVRAEPLEIRVNALSEILIGPTPDVLDPRQQVRLVALRGLFQPAIQGNRVAQASIRHAAANDPAGAVRSAASEMLEYSSTW